MYCVSSSIPEVGFEVDHVHFNVASQAAHKHAREWTSALVLLRLAARKIVEVDVSSFCMSLDECVKEEH